MLSDLISKDLKSGYDKILAIKKNPDHSQEDIQEVYKRDILPHLLQLRHQNRKEKDDLEAKSSKVKDLYEQLSDLQQTCDSLSYMVLCLKSQAGIQNISTDSKNIEPANDIFDPNSVIKLDHNTRMQILDEEETKRKELQRRLIDVNAETKIYELQCSQNSNQLNDVKPHIRQLLEKVGPTINPLLP